MQGMHAGATQRLAEATVETWSHVAARVASGEPADAVLQAWWKAHRYYGARDRRFIAESLFAAFRWRGWFGIAPIEPARLLGLAFLLEAREPHPVAHILAAAGSRSGTPVPAGLLDLDQKARWLMDQLGWPEAPGWPALVPDWVPQVVEADHLESFVRSVQQRPPVWLRARKGEGPATADWLAGQGIGARPHLALPEALSLDRAPPAPILAALERKGCVVQDILSQSVGWACGAKPGQHWWDMCAGAGGKTLQLLEDLQGKGQLLASDIREAPLKELQRRASSFEGPLTLRLLRPDEPPPGAPFDGILVDAPCSGLGTWGRNPDARWRTTRETVDRMSAQQGQLLRRACRYLKRGGVLVFATCSVASPEGGAVLEPLLQEGLIRLESWHFPPYGQRPLTRHTLWPADGPGTGMFVARALSG